VSVTRCESAKVNIRVFGHAARVVRPYFQDYSLAVGTILKVMSVRLARLEAGACACLEKLFSCIGHQHHFAFEDVDELVVVAVPVPLTGPRAGRKAAQVHPKAGESSGSAEAPALAVLTGHVVRRGVPGAEAGRRLLDIDLLHSGESTLALVVEAA
jgi:hypothetical protein